MGYGVENIKVAYRKTMQNPVVDTPNGAICCKLWPKTILGWVGQNLEEMCLQTRYLLCLQTRHLLWQQKTCLDTDVMAADQTDVLSADTADVLSADTFLESARIGKNATNLRF